MYFRFSVMHANFLSFGISFNSNGPCIVQRNIALMVENVINLRITMKINRSLLTRLYIEGQICKEETSVIYLSEEV